MPHTAHCYDFTGVGSHFHGSFRFEGKDYPFVGSFHKPAPEPFETMLASLQFDNVQQLKGVYFITPGAHVGPHMVDFPLARLTTHLHIKAALQSAAPETYVTGRLKWVTKAA